jgi:hypothetical protein
LPFNNVCLFFLSIAADPNDDDPTAYSDLIALHKPGPDESPEYMNVDEDGNVSDYDDEEFLTKTKTVNWQSSWTELNFSEDKLKVHSLI